MQFDNFSEPVKATSVVDDLLVQPGQCPDQLVEFLIIQSENGHERCRRSSEILLGGHVDQSCSQPGPRPVGVVPCVLSYRIGTAGKGRLERAHPRQQNVTQLHLLVHLV